jgi:hypothetical protein
VTRFTLAISTDRVDHDYQGAAARSGRRNPKRAGEVADPGSGVALFVELRRNTLEARSPSDRLMQRRLAHQFDGGSPDATSKPGFSGLGITVFSPRFSPSEVPGYKRSWSCLRSAPPRD